MPPSRQPLAMNNGSSTRRHRGSSTWVRSPAAPVLKHKILTRTLGTLNQAEYSERIDPILESHNGEKVRLHNKLLMAIYANVSREMPDQTPAPWVSANNKPATGAGSKPVTGDAAERRLKGDVMQLPTRDRRRIKDLAMNDVCCFIPFE
jgi:transcriptional coactivator HFI1/ADA1